MWAGPYHPDRAHAISISTVCRGTRSGGPSWLPGSSTFRKVLAVLGGTSETTRQIFEINDISRWSR